MTAAQGAIRARNTPYETAGKNRTPGAAYNINYGHHELARFHPWPTAAKREFNHVPVRPALWPNPPALWLVAFKFGDLGRSDAPHNARRTPPDARALPKLVSPEGRYPVITLLVNPKGGNPKRHPHRHHQPRNLPPIVPHHCPTENEPFNWRPTAAPCWKLCPPDARRHRPPRPPPRNPGTGSRPQTARNRRPAHVADAA